MGHASQEALKVAKKFVAGKDARSPLVSIMFHQGVRKGRRLVSSGGTLLSYEWWVVAERIDDAIFVTNRRYQTGTWASGKPKYSPTTDGHIDAVKQELVRAGYYLHGGDPKWLEYRRG